MVTEDKVKLYNEGKTAALSTDDLQDILTYKRNVKARERDNDIAQLTGLISGYNAERDVNKRTETLDTVDTLLIKHGLSIALVTGKGAGKGSRREKGKWRDHVVPGMTYEVINHPEITWIYQEATGFNNMSPIDFLRKNSLDKGGKYSAPDYLVMDISRPRMTVAEAILENIEPGVNKAIGEKVTQAINTGK